MKSNVDMMAGYREELLELYHRRVTYIIIVGVSMILLFSLLDYLVVPSLFTEFLRYRIGAALVGVVLLVVHLRVATIRFAPLIGFIGFLCVTLTLLLMIYRMGGLTSPYYVGLIITMTIYSALAPLTPIETLASGCILVCLYLITIVPTGWLAQSPVEELFNNLFFMVCFVFIATTQSWTDTVARKREFLLIKQETQATDELSRHAEILEHEVAVRARQQAASEQRYRQLFNQIVDAVVVIAEKGRIIQSNNAFDEHFAPDTIGSDTSLYEIVPEASREPLQRALERIRETGEALSFYRLSLISARGARAEVEISGSLVVREGHGTAVLLLIRDMTPRKELEAKLIESLKTKKQTETATMLALAKLSEFKDLTPRNHLERIREYCRILADELARDPNLDSVITDAYIQNIYHASILHDIGKVSIPDQLHRKTGVLDDREEDMIRRHTLVGGEVIREMEAENIRGGFLEMARHIAYFHHERWDGTGYPYGLKEREIPLAARIMAVADTYEEMTARNEHGVGGNEQEHAEATICKGAGTLFDPLVVKAFVTRKVDITAVRNRYPAV